MLGISLVAVLGCAPAASDNPDTSDVSQSADALVTYSGDVDTTDWKTYSNESMGFELQYPPSFQVNDEGQEVKISRSGDESGDQIVIRSIQSTLKDQVSTVIYAANAIESGDSTVVDNNVRSRIAHFQSADAYSWFMTYFLMRDADYPQFPDFMETDSYNIIVADVEAFISEEEYQQMIEMSPEYIGPEVFLSEPQQILSTFRFLEN